MRGLAALVVVFAHFLMLFPKPKLNMAFNFVIHVFTSGRESVILFFVLSGFVLSLPYLKGKQNTYGVFLQRRIARIYGPYLVALVPAVVGCALWHSQSELWRSVCLTWTQPVTVRSLVDHVTFLGVYANVYNLAFWSLVYEMRISLFFPLLFLLVRRAALPGTGLVFLVFMVLGIQMSDPSLAPSAIGTLMPTFEYAGFFLLGILLAEHQETITSWFRKHSTLWKMLFASTSFLLYEGGHMFLRTAKGESHKADVVESFGACGLIVLALNSTRVANLLKTKIPLFLGRISYSLYLVHCTVLFALFALFHGRISNTLMFVAVVSLSLLLGWGFNVAVEQPFIRLSQSIGRRVAARQTNQIPSLP